MTAPQDQILAIAFGDHLPGDLGVTVDLRVRTVEGGQVVEGTRDSIVMAYAVLEQWQAALPAILAEIDRAGGTAKLPPAEGPLPDWNGGRAASREQPPRFICTLFGVRAASPDYDAAVAVVEAKPAGGSEVHAADYLVSRDVLLQLQDAIPKVLRKRQQKKRLH